MSYLYMCNMHVNKYVKIYVYKDTDIDGKNIDG